MIRTLIAATVVALAVHPAAADMRDDCVQSDDVPRSIDGCSKVIASGNWTGDDLAMAHYNRANGYRRTGRPQEALADYDKALSINPGMLNAHINRGLVRCSLGNQAGFLIDMRVAMKASGEEVARFQTLMQRDGFYTGAVDGRYGPATEQALQRFAETLCSG
ncbi:MAG: tetratricopeptide repeat protein [Pseudomonadota bacterium]